MSYLIDTYPLLWYLKGDRRLSSAARDVLEEGSNTILISVGSLWEIAILHNLERLTLKMPIRIGDRAGDPGRLSDWVRTYILDLGIDLLSLSPRHLDVYTRLPMYHPDPFDRLVIAQAKTEGLTIISKNERFPEYGVEVLW